MAFRSNTPKDKSRFLTNSFEDTFGNKYTRQDAENVVLWLRMYPNAPIDLSKNNIEAHYEGSPQDSLYGKTDLGTSGDVSYPYINVEQESNFGQGTHVKSTGSNLSFSKLASGASHSLGADKPFSVSLWVYTPEHTANINYNGFYLFAKSSGSHNIAGINSTNTEYFASIMPGPAPRTNPGRITFSIIGDNTSNSTGGHSLMINAPVLNHNSWNHLVFTYRGGDSTGVSDLDQIMAMYVNGSRMTTSLIKSLDADFSSMVPSDTKPLSIGNSIRNRKGPVDDIRIADFVMWSKELSSESVSAIYNEYKKAPRGYSGSSSLSPRVQSIDELNRHDVYSKFDDSLSVEFIDPRCEAVLQFNGIPRDAHTIEIIEKNADSSSQKVSKVFEFQKGVILAPGNVEVNIKNSRTPSQVAEKFVAAVNSQTNRDWPYIAIQKTKTSVTVQRTNINEMTKIQPLSTDLRDYYSNDGISFDLTINPYLRPAQFYQIDVINRIDKSVHPSVPPWIKLGIVQTRELRLIFDNTLDSTQHSVSNSAATDGPRSYIALSVGTSGVENNSELADRIVGAINQHGNVFGSPYNVYGIYKASRSTSASVNDSVTITVTDIYPKSQGYLMYGPASYEHPGFETLSHVRNINYATAGYFTATSGQLKKGTTYKIKTEGNADFRLAGSADNNVGTSFVANGNDPGDDGVVDVDMFTITRYKQELDSITITSTGGITKKYIVVPHNVSSATSGDLLEIRAATNYYYYGIPIEVGKKYEIVSVDDTDWTTVGASSNTVGEVFTASNLMVGIDVSLGGTPGRVKELDTVVIELNPGWAGINDHTQNSITAAQIASEIVTAINSPNGHGNDKSIEATLSGDQVILRHFDHKELKIERSYKQGPYSNKSLKIEQHIPAISTTIPERFVEVKSNFSENRKPSVVYPGLDVVGSLHVKNRKSISKASQSDIEIIRPVHRSNIARVDVEEIISPFNEAHAQISFGFEEGLEGLSPERGIESDFYISGSVGVVAPSSIKNKKQIVIDMPNSSDVSLQMKTTPGGNVNDNFPMAYYNFSEQKWDHTGLGSGSFDIADTGDVENRKKQMQQALDFTMVGFGPSTDLPSWKTDELYGSSFKQRFEFESRDTTKSPTSGRILGVGSLASPTNVFGFPFHPKYHAVDNQLLKMENYIDRPFILEKVLIEVSVGSDQADTRTMDNNLESASPKGTVDLDTTTFFILNQRSTAVGSELKSLPSVVVSETPGSGYKNPHTSIGIITNPIGSSTATEGLSNGFEVGVIPRSIGLTKGISDGSTGKPEVLVETMRDLVTWSRLTVSPTGFDSSKLDPVAKDVRKESDLVIEQNDSQHPLPFGLIDTDGQPHDTYGPPVRYSISAPCRAAVAQIASGSFPVGGTSAVKLSSGYFGITKSSDEAVPVLDNTPEAEQYIQLTKSNTGRTSADIQSGRAIVSENPASSPLYTIRTDQRASSKITAYDRDSKDSPYVILPTDKLIIGCQSPISYNIDGSTHPKIVLRKGDARIILYGYYIQGEKEDNSKHSNSATGNSKFFSENIGSVEVSDQFETHPRMTYYRSSLDEVVTGSMQDSFTRMDSPQGQNVDNFTTDVQAIARQVVGRNSQGTQGKKGSLLRGRKASDSSEIYYDSMPPNLRSLMLVDGVNMIDITSGSASSTISSPSIVLGLPGSNSAYTSFYGEAQNSAKLIWDTWYQSYPFEARYSNIARNPSIEKNILMPTYTPVGDSGIGSPKRDKISSVAIALFDNAGDLKINAISGSEGSSLITSPSHRQLLPSSNTESLFYNKGLISDASYITWRTNTFGDADSNLEPQDATATTAEMKITVANFANNNSGNTQASHADVIQFSLAGTVVNLGFDPSIPNCTSSNIAVLDEKVLINTDLIENGDGLTNGKVYKITTALGTNWSSVGGPNPASDGDVFTANGNTNNTGSTLGKVVRQASDEEECAILVKQSLDLAFSSNTNVAVTRSGAVLTITVSNRAWLTTPQSGGYVQPTLDGSGVPDSDFMTVTSDFTGNDLVAIVGAPLKGVSVQKAVGNNNTKHLETVAFASVLAEDQTNRTVSELIDIDESSGTRNTNIIHELGSSLESDADYYSKLFFGTGEGMFKSPTHRLNKPSNVSLEAVNNTRIAVKHGFVSSPYNLSANFILHTDDGFENTYTYSKASSLKAWWKLDEPATNVITRFTEADLVLTSGNSSSVNDRTIVIGSGDAQYNGTNFNGGGKPSWANNPINENDIIAITHNVTLNSGSGAVTQEDANDVYRVGALGGTTVTLTRVNPENVGGTCASYTASLQDPIVHNSDYVVKKDSSTITTITLWYRPIIDITAMSTSTFYEIVDMGSTVFDSSVGTGYSQATPKVGTTFTSKGSGIVSITGGAKVRLAPSPTSNKIFVKLVESQVTSDGRKGARDLIIKAANGVNDPSIVYATSGNGLIGAGIPDIYGQRSAALHQFDLVAKSPGTASNGVTGTTGLKLVVPGPTTHNFTGGINAPTGTHASGVGLSGGSRVLLDGAHSHNRETPAVRVSRGSNNFIADQHSGFSAGRGIKWDRIIGNTVTSAAAASDTDGSTANLTNGTGTGEDSSHGTGKFTVSGWIKGGTASKGYANIMSFGGWDSARESGFQVSLRNGALTLYNRYRHPGTDSRVSSNLPSYFFISNALLNDEKWHHFAVTLDLSVATLNATNPSSVGAPGSPDYDDKTGLATYIFPKFYVDGVEVTASGNWNGSNQFAEKTYWPGVKDQQASAGGGSVTETSDVRIAGWSDDGSGQYTFEGRISELSVWNDVLTASDVKAIYNVSCKSYINTEDMTTTPRFTSIGVGTSARPDSIVSPTTGYNFFTGFTATDTLLSFDASPAARQLTLIEEVKSGQTVRVKLAGGTFDSDKTYGSDGTSPTLKSSLDRDAEDAEQDREMLFIMVSTDGGSTWDYLTNLVTQGVLSHDSDFDVGTSLASGYIQSRLTKTELGPSGTAFSENFSQGAYKETTATVSNVGHEYYPSISFVAPSDLKIAIQQPQNENIQNDHIFCRYLSIQITQGDASSISDVFNTPRTGKANYSQQARAEKITVRGAKYGLISPIKLNTSAIFRAGSFGNIRDMLEQRAFTRTFNGSSPSEPPVQVSFVQRKNKLVVSPEETNSANLDVFCTSSLPYFDGIVRDRTSSQPDLLDEIDVNIITSMV